MKKTPRTKSPSKKKLGVTRSLWDRDPAGVRRAFAAVGDLELRRDDDDLFMRFLDPDGKLQQEYGEEICEQREVIQAIVGIQTYGSVAEIKDAQGILQSAALVLKWIHLQPTARWDKDAPGEAGNKVLEEVIRLNHVQMMAESYEERLRQHGLRYDSESGIVISKGGRGRPSPFINRVVGTQALALRDTYRKPEDLQAEIHRRLSYFFRLPENAAGSRGTIARAIENAERYAPKDSVRNNQRKGLKPA